jgi:hypothetical protein
MEWDILSQCKNNQTFDCFKFCIFDTHQTHTTLSRSAKQAVLRCYKDRGRYSTSTLDTIKQLRQVQSQLRTIIAPYEFCDYSVVPSDMGYLWLFFARFSSVCAFGKM